MVQSVIVVGAGMAGLAAAQSLQDAGLRVVVVERLTRVGGRVHSVPFHGRVVECGAQFASTGYRHMPPLLQRAGLAEAVVPTSPWGAFDGPGRLHRVHQNRPGTLVSGGLLRWHEAGRLVIGALPTLARTRRLDKASYAAFAALDDQDAFDWSSRTLGGAATTQVFEPTVHGLYFHPLQGTSRALLCALLAFRGAQALAVRGGWAALPRQIAKGLHVQTGREVQSLVQTDRGVRAQLGGEIIVADWALLATPAPTARALLPDATVAEQVVLRATYAAAIHLAFGMHPAWLPPAELHEVHGVLLGPGERGAEPALVASLVLESARLVQTGPPVLCAMMGDGAARRHASESDDALAGRVVRWLDTRWPGTGAAVLQHRVQRWGLAEPLSPVGRARSIAHYRQQLTPARRIVLCGDYLGLPWTDGAVESGLWAADHLIRASCIAKPSHPSVPPKETRA